MKVEFPGPVWQKLLCLRRGDVFIISGSTSLYMKLETEPYYPGFNAVELQTGKAVLIDTMTMVRKIDNVKVVTDERD